MKKLSLIVFSLSLVIVWLFSITYAPYKRSLNKRYGALGIVPKFKLR